MVIGTTCAALAQGYSLEKFSPSVQYPNAWYFKKARKQEQLFPDWVVLLIEAHYLWQVGVKFCPRNAAAEYGTLIDEGAQAFEALFAETVVGTRQFRRGPGRPLFLPTDEQAEVLVPDCVPWRDVVGIAVRDEGQAKREIARQRILRRNFPSIVIAPEFFDPDQLSSMLRVGNLPLEREHQ